MKQIVSIRFVQTPRLVRSTDEHTFAGAEERVETKNLENLGGTVSENFFLPFTNYDVVYRLFGK